MAINVGFHIKNYKNFGPAGAGIEEIRAINLIIGRNNIGKSSLLEALDFLCLDKNSSHPIKPSIEISRFLDETELKHVFRENSYGGDLDGNHWLSHGKKFIGARIIWKQEALKSIKVLGLDCPASDAEGRKLSGILIDNALQSYTHIKLDADRDILPEAIDKEISLDSKGTGATQITHKYLHHEGYDRSIIQTQLLNALNDIFLPDIKFNEITTRFHDETEKWEIFLGEETKGPIALSRSGSGLKTILLTLMNLLVRPNYEKKITSKYIFSLEELENNLHPALQRNLFAFLKNFAVENKCHIFLTTHPNVAIDIYSGSADAQIIHIMRRDSGVAGSTYGSQAEGHGILDDLGIRASDLLQANGLIWVEGPSDRVFLNKWISLWSNNELSEGLNYQFVFYGGSILANINASTEESDTQEAISAFKINRNFAFICDSDRKSATGLLKTRVSKLISEVADSRGMVWVTQCTEIENYIPKEAFEAVHNKTGLPQIGEYESITNYLTANKISKAQNYNNKHSKAFLYAEHLTLQNLSFRSELHQKLTELVKKIRSWSN